VTLTIDTAAESPQPAALNAQLAQEAAARLFRSVRAGRSWLRARESLPAAGQVGGCVAMKPGNDDPPLFMVPGAPGSILQLGPLATALPVPIAVYAIKPRGLEEGETPCESLVEMAQYGISAIRRVRPSGPYLLAGYSAGGLVALEMAQQLTAAGDDVALVVLVDTYPSRQNWPLRCHAEILAGRSVSALRSLMRYSPRQAMREARRRLASLSGYLATSGVKALPLPEVVPEGVSAASRRVHIATYNAGEAYRPSRYSGKVVLVQPESVPPLYPRKSEKAWRLYLTDLEVCRVSGSHLEMVEAGAAATAAPIGECLAQALQCRSPAAV
jgi:acetoacetyl-CoA synthetase